jgi:hypothetical protein
MLPFHIFSYTLRPKTVENPLYQDKLIEDLEDLQASIEADFREIEAWLNACDEDEDDEVELDANDIAIIDHALQNTWRFDESNFDDWEDDEDELLR